MSESAKERLIEERWFKETPEGLVLVGSKCSACGKVFFPKKEYVCPNCFQEEKLEEYPLSKRGKLHSYAVVYKGPPEFPSPYAFAWIELPPGIKLFSMLADWEPPENILKIDMEMEMIIDKVKIIQTPQGQETLIGYKFRPVKSA
jgi:uncharacterized OB-fold protein